MPTFPDNCFLTRYSMGLIHFRLEKSFTLHPMMRTPSLLIPKRNCGRGLLKGHTVESDGY